MKPIKKKIVLYICIVVLVMASVAMAGHRHPEKWYQEKWCTEAGGVMEVVLEGGARVDCLTDEYAIEFDFGPKWAEAIGQALFYGFMTNKKPGIVLIMEHPKDQRYLKRLEAVAEKLGIRVWVMK